VTRRWWYVTWTAVVQAEDSSEAGQEADEMRKKDGGRYRVRPVTDEEIRRLGLT
jgi:hypothetical protein